MKQVLVKPYFNSLIKEFYHIILLLIVLMRDMGKKMFKHRNHQNILGQKSLQSNHNLSKWKLISYT